MAFHQTLNRRNNIVQGSMERKIGKQKTEKEKGDERGAQRKVEGNRRVTLGIMACDMTSLLLDARRTQLFWALNLLMLF